MKGENMVGKKVLNWLLGLAVGVANLLGMKLMITIDEHRIDVELVKPDKLRERVWDSSHYVNGNIYVKGYGNPIKPLLDKAENKVELVSSERYKNFMRMKILKELIKTAEGTGWTTKKLLKLILAVVLILAGLFAVFVILMLGGI